MSKYICELLLTPFSHQYHWYMYLSNVHVSPSHTNKNLDKFHRKKPQESFSVSFRLK